MSNQNTFLLILKSELYSSFSNNHGADFWYSDMKNIRRLTLKSSYENLVRSDPIIEIETNIESFT